MHKDVEDNVAASEKREKGVSQMAESEDVNSAQTIQRTKGA